MESKRLKLNQFMSAVLASLIFAFSVSSYPVAARAKSCLSENQVSVTQSIANIAPQEDLVDRVVSVIHVTVIQISSDVLKANIPFIRYVNCDAFFVNAHVRNAIYALPNIHAP